MNRSLFVGLVAMLLLAACGGDTDLQVGHPADEPADYAYTIPVGAGDALDRGEPLEILPGRLDAEIGEIIEIVNEDERGHLVGPFYVGAGETLRQRFLSPGEFVGQCTVHPSGELILVVHGP